jgi:hypothetical protein
VSCITPIRNGTPGKQLSDLLVNNRAAECSGRPVLRLDI